MWVLRYTQTRMHKPGSFTYPHGHATGVILMGGLLQAVTTIVLRIHFRPIRTVSTPWPEVYFVGIGGN